jgi:glycosyltransferase involved in cell wall biosynthesis
VIEPGKAFKKKVVIIYGSLQNIYIGAPGHVILDTIRHLPEPEKINWSVLYYHTSPKREVIQGVPVVAVPYTLFDSLITNIIRLLPQACKKRYFVTSNLAYIRYLISVVRTLFFDRPHVVVVHVSYPLPHMVRFILPKAKILYYHHGCTMHTKLTSAQWGRLENSCNGVIAVSQAAFDGLLARYGNINVPYWVLYNGSSLKLNENMAAKRKAIRHKYQLTNKTVFIFCGRMVASKGIIPLVNAFKKLLLLKDSIALLLVGDANVGQDERDQENAKEYVKNAVVACKGSIVATGWIQKDLVGDYIMASDIAILPSLAPEGISLFAIDSLALAKPLIATDTGGNREVSITEVTGLLISSSKETVEADLFSAMKRLLHDKLLYDNCSDGAQKLSKLKFSAEVMSELFNDIIVRVCVE